MKKEELVLGDEVVITYMYSEPLKPIESTIPLCDGAHMAQISIPHYAKIEDINFTINMYAER